MRRYAIPIQALALVTTQTACSDLMLGDWEGIRLVTDYGETELPVVYSSYYGGESRTQVELTLTRERTGTLSLFQSYGNYESYDRVMDMTAERIANGVWEVRVPEFYELEMTCTADRVLLDCDGTNDGAQRLDIDFERVDY